MEAGDIAGTISSNQAGIQGYPTVGAPIDPELSDVEIIDTRWGSHRKHRPAVVAVRTRKIQICGSLAAYAPASPHRQGLVHDIGGIFKRVAERRIGQDGT